MEDYNTYNELFTNLIENMICQNQSTVLCMKCNENCIIKKSKYYLHDFGESNNFYYSCKNCKYDFIY